MIPHPLVFEEAIALLWSGRSSDREGYGTMADAVFMAEFNFHGEAYLKAWLRPGRERKELIPRKLIYSSQEKQAARAMFLMLMMELAQQGVPAPTD